MAKYEKGQSGNPSGRPKGIVDRRRRYAKLFESKAPAVIDRIIKSALAGDVAASKLIIDRVIPRLRPESMPCWIEPDTDSAADRSHAIVSAMLRGDVSPDQATEVIKTLAAQVQLLEHLDLEERLKLLEHEVDRSKL